MKSTKFAKFVLGWNIGGNALMLLSVAIYDLLHSQETFAYAQRLEQVQGPGSGLGYVLGFYFWAVFFAGWLYLSRKAYQQIIDLRVQFETRLQSVASTGWENPKLPDFSKIA